MKKKTILLPKVVRILAALGENIKLARLRRRFSSQQIAERANISRSTLHAIECGVPSVSMGSYAQVLFVLGLERDLLKEQWMIFWVESFRIPVYWSKNARQNKMKKNSKKSREISQ